MLQRIWITLGRFLVDVILRETAICIEHLDAKFLFVIGSFLFHSGICNDVDIVSGVFERTCAILHRQEVAHHADSCACNF